MRLIQLGVLLGLCAGSCLGQADPMFTYQGRFSDQGELANGEYDIQVKVWDADTVGNELLVRTFNDLLVEDGLIQLSLPLEGTDGTPLFDGSPRWIAVGFRPGDNGSIFDPFFFGARQLVTFAPEAAHALRADVADLADVASVAMVADELANPTWDEVSGGIVYGTGGSRIGINTNGTLGFGALTVNTDTDGQGGMLISTTGASGSPYLGLLSNFGGLLGGGTTAYLTLDGASGVMSIRDNDFQAQLNTSTAGVEVVSDLTVGQNVTSPSFSYPTPQVRTMSLSSTAWRPEAQVSYIAYDFSEGGRAYINQVLPTNTSMYLPLSLPDGAVIQREGGVRVYANVKVGNRAVIQLRSARHDGSSLFSQSGVILDGADSYPVPLENLSVAPTFTVDNQNVHYFLEISSSDWDPSAGVSVGGVVIEYSVVSPD